jgi:hypothetical protein
MYSRCPYCGRPIRIEDRKGGWGGGGWGGHGGWGGGGWHRDEDD